MQRSLSHQFQVDGPIDQVFPLFDPRHEDEWAPNWNFHAVQPQPWRNEANAVFRVDQAAGRELWIVLDFDPNAHRAEYLALRGERFIRRVTVRCAPQGAATAVDVRYDLTALDAEGAAQMAHYDQAFLEAWATPIQAAARKRALA